VEKIFVDGEDFDIRRGTNMELNNLPAKMYIKSRLFALLYPIVERKTPSYIAWLYQLTSQFGNIDVSPERSTGLSTRGNSYINQKLARLANVFKHM
jgi:hypothetical protein